jgi:hypothetical protein
MPVLYAAEPLDHDRVIECAFAHDVVITTCRIFIIDFCMQIIYT